MKYNYVKHRDNAGDLEYFISKFECRVEDSREYNQYVRPAPYHLDFYSTDSFKMETKITPMKAIHLSSDNLERLIRDQERLDQLLDQQLYDKQVIAKLRRDEQVRNSNLAVEKAYQKYVMLLELARK